MSVVRALTFLLAILLSAAGARAAGMPDELRAVLKGFRSEGSKGWGFTQSTVGAGKSLLERYDPARRENERWTLVQKDGQPPTETQLRDYGQRQSRRSSNDTAPNVKDQLDETTGELVSDDGTRAVWRFKLKATEDDDSSAPHMAAIFTLHRPTSTIERMEVGSFEPFRPVWFISIEEARTVVEYSLPTEGRPTLLNRITVKVRGKSWWVKSLDEDMTVTYSDFAPAGRKPVVP